MKGVISNSIQHGARLNRSNKTLLAGLGRRRQISVDEDKKSVMFHNMRLIRSYRQMHEFDEAFYCV